ncbi:hypothetical protein ACE0DR_04315 [Azotobacter sp. CWF10]
METGHLFWAVAAMMVGWGALNAAIPVCWSTWLAREIDDEPESGGGLLVASIQLAIMMGGALGGQLLDHANASAPWWEARSCWSFPRWSSATAPGSGNRHRPEPKAAARPVPLPALHEALWMKNFDDR